MAERKKASDIGLRKAALICNMPPDPHGLPGPGLAAGVPAHGIGTARAFQVNELACAFAGIGIGLNGVVTAVLVPLLLAA